MQKHERQILEAAREEASKVGMIARLEHSRTEKVSLIVENPAGFVARFRVPCSPRDRDNIVGFVRQWVRRVIRRHPCG